MFTIQIILDRDLLSPSRKSQSDLNEFTGQATETFNEVYEKLEKYYSQQIMFNREDELEIARGDSYRFLASLPEKITITNFKEALRSDLGILDNHQQNFIITILNQKQSRWLYAITDVLGTLLTALSFELSSLFIVDSKQREINLAHSENNVFEIAMKVPIYSQKFDNSTIKERIGIANIGLRVGLAGKFTISPYMTVELNFIEEEIAIRVKNNLIKIIKAHPIESSEENGNAETFIISPAKPVPNIFIRQFIKYPWLTAALIAGGVGCLTNATFSASSLSLLTALAKAAKDTLSLNSLEILAIDAVLGTVLGVSSTVIANLIYRAVIHCRNYYKNQYTLAGTEPLQSPSSESNQGLASMYKQRLSAKPSTVTIEEKRTIAFSPSSSAPIESTAPPPPFFQRRPSDIQVPPRQTSREIEEPSSELISPPAYR